MKELVEYIVKSLVENPDKVKVSTEEESEKVTILNIEVDSNDLGKVIGKGGKIANSIRTKVNLNKRVLSFNKECNWLWCRD